MLPLGRAVGLVDIVEELRVESVGNHQQYKIQQLRRAEWGKGMILLALNWEYDLL